MDNASPLTRPSVSTRAMSTHGNVAIFNVDISYRHGYHVYFTPIDLQTSDTSDKTAHDRNDVID